MTKNTRGSCFAAFAEALIGKPIDVSEEVVVSTIQVPKEDAVRAPEQPCQEEVQQPKPVVEVKQRTRTMIKDISEARRKPSERIVTSDFMHRFTKYVKEDSKRQSIVKSLFKRNRISPSAILLEDDTMFVSNFLEFIAPWNDKYYDRFSSWYVRRQEKTSLVRGKSFTGWACTKKDDVFHHATNWELQRQRMMAKPIVHNKKMITFKYHVRNYTTKPKQNGRHPHPPLHPPLTSPMPSFPFDIKNFQPSLNVNAPEFIPQAEAGVDQQDSLVQVQNTTFTDQRETVVDDGYITSQTEPNLQQVSMPEEQWHVRNIMAKPIPFYSGEWSTTQERGKIIKQWKIPGDTLFGPHYNQVATFTFFRGHPTIRFQINGTKFHSGRLIAAFIPAYEFTSYDDKIYSINNLTSLPHVILDASIANSGVLNLPFVHMNTYFNSISSRGWQSLGSLLLVVFNKLGAATSSSQSIGVTAWISYDNCELHQPCYAHTVNIPNSSTTPQAEAGIEGLMKSAIPMITDLAAPGLGTALNAVGNVAGGAANMDKPTDPIEIQRWVPNAVTGLSTGEGLDRSTRLCLTPGSYTLGDADLISTTKDDMNLLEIAKIPTRLYVVDWKDTEATGSRIAHFPTCPNVISTSTNNDKVKPPVTVYEPTLLAYISRYFKFWRGGLRYKIQIVASQMHTGRLMISYGAGLCLSKEGAFAKASYLNTYVIDLQEKHEVEFVVPYLAERPWLRCDRMREVANNDFITSNFEQTGYLGIYVLNKLSRPDNVAATVDINIFVSAADDFELAFPSDLAGFQGIGDVIVPPTEEVPQAEALTTQEAVSTRTDEGSVTLVKGSGTVSTAGPKTMSENAMDLKTLLRRYTKVYVNRLSNVGDGANMISFVNTPTLSNVNKCFNDKNGIQFRTALSHFSTLYTFWRGSLRYKLVFGKVSPEEYQDLIITVVHVPGIFVKGNFTPTSINRNNEAIYDAFESMGTIVMQTHVQASLEFEIPFYTPYTQLRTLTENLHNSRSATGLVFINFRSPATTHKTVPYFTLYQAAGDDFSLNYLRAAPKIQFVKDSDNKRIINDNAGFIFTDIPNICNLDKFYTDDDVPQAEALIDYIPGATTVRDTISGVNSSVAKVDSVCDTANHILLQASKKLGLAAEDEDEEEHTTTLLEDVSSFCSPILPVLEQLIEHAKLFPSMLNDYLQPNLSTISIMTEVSNLISGFTAYGSATNILQKICAIVTIVSTLLKGITTTLKNSLYHFTSQVFSNLYGSKQGNELPNAESNQLDIVAPFTATLAVAIGALGFKKIPTDKETTDLCKGISEKLRLFNFSSMALSNIKSLWNEISELVQWIIDTVLNLISPQLLAQLKLQKEFEDITTWAEFIDSLDTIAYTDKIHYDYEFRNKIFKAIDKGKYYNTLLLEGKCGRAASVIREYVRKAMEIGVHCMNSKNELPFRKDPFCIAMFGPSDIGKSGCITTVGFDIMDDLGYPQHNRWCAVNCTEKYFSENYRQQSATYFDDFSTFTSEEQYQKFFNLKANTAFPLDMAFRKGEYFNSDFIFMTTNTPYPQPNFVTHHQALLRRRDMLIEAAWIDSEEIAAALRNNENMARFRHLDNSHLKFRVRNSVDPQAQPGAWMTYQEIVQVCINSARDHLTRQQAKLTHDLTRAGYIVPHAEAAEQRRICIEAAKVSPSLQLFDPLLWTDLQWDADEKKFFCEEKAMMWDEWQACVNFFHASGMDLQHFLLLNSYVVKDKVSLVSKIKSSFTDFKDYLKECMDSLFESHPWIKEVARWSLLLAGSFAALGLIWYGTKAVVHKCMCKTLLTYGYRCGFCGKWPAAANIKPELYSWMMDQWRDLYGSVPYKDYYITSTKEEAALLSLQKHFKCEVLNPKLGTKPEAEGIYSENTQGAKTLKITAQGNNYSENTKGSPAARVVAETEQVESVIENRIFPYLYKLRTLGKAGLPSMVIHGYAIGQRFVLINSHFFYGLEDGDIFEIHHNGAWLPIEFIEKQAIKVPNKDLWIYEMPIQFHAHKDNTHHFISEKELPYFQIGKGHLCKLTPTHKQAQVTDLKIQALTELKFNLTIAGKEVPYYVQKAWKYPKCSSHGDCGSVLVADTNKLSGIILGIHIASDPFTSYSQLVTKEMLAPLITRKLGTPIPKAEAVLGNLIPPGHFGRIGQVPLRQQLFTKNVTEIVPTKIQGIISQPVTFPTVLKSTDPRLTVRVNPLRNGIQKYANCSIPFPSKHRYIVNKFMRDETRKFRRVRNPTPLSFEQACNGIQELDGYERLPRNTSPGFPWVLQRKDCKNLTLEEQKGKNFLFPNDEPSEVLRKAFDQRDAMAQLQERVESVWVDCLKDERRALPKIEKGETRIFTIPPIDFSLLLRKYTLDFSAAVKNSRDFMDCKVGIDPQSFEWTTLYCYMNSFSPFIVAGDFSSFDGSMPADIIDDVRGDVDFYYSAFGDCSNFDINARKILFDEMIHTVHMAKNEFYMTHIGNKSGNPFTVILNSRVNKRYMALAWLGLCESMDKMEYYSMSSFENHVRMATYGDDNMLAIKEEVLEWFNQETISHYLEKFNIIYTNESKTGITKFKSLDECTFLKQSFHNHEQFSFLKVPHMSEKTIHELLNWTRDAEDDQLLIDNCNDALRFAYFYGEEYFERLRLKIIDALTTVGVSCMLPKTYMDYHLWFMVAAGILKGHKSAEGFLLDLAHADTPAWKRNLQMLTLGPLTPLMKMLISKEDDGRVRSSRGAICIPSGEGKTWLCTHYPQLFIDHDDLILPHLEQELSSLISTEKWMAVGNALLNPQHIDAPEEDRRILLTHHPNTTNRTILGKYVLPHSNYNRNNWLNRLLLKSPSKMTREERNIHILDTAHR